MLPLLRKLASIFRLNTAEEQALASIPMQVRELPADQDIVREGDRPSHCCLLLEGFAYRYQGFSDGRRQIMSFHAAGDIPDLLSLHLEVMDHSLATLAPSKIGVIAHRDLHLLIQDHPRIGDACWRDTLIDLRFSDNGWSGSGGGAPTPASPISCANRHTHVGGRAGRRKLGADTAHTGRSGRFRSQGSPRFT